MDERVNRTRSVTRFGEKLKALRTHQNLTLQSLAYLIGHTAHGYLSEIESGKKMPSVDFVVRVSRLFHVTTDELLKDELELDLSKGRNDDARRSVESCSRESANSNRISDQGANDIE